MNEWRENEARLMNGRIWKLNFKVLRLFMLKTKQIACDKIYMFRRAESKRSCA
jgi:hypothetical protein